MIRLRVMTEAEEREWLRRAAATREPFLDADPVTENVSRMHRRLQDRAATLLAVEDDDATALAGFARNPANPGQAYVDVVPLTIADPELAVDALIRFLTDYYRIESFLRVAAFRDSRGPLFRGCGFEEIGTLPEHCYGAGRYHDAPVLHLHRALPTPEMSP